MGAPYVAASGPRPPLAGRLAPDSLLVDLCNDLTAFHAHLEPRTTPQGVYEGLRDAHDALLRALRLLRQANP